MIDIELVSRIFEEFQHPAISNQNSAALWQVFSSNKRPIQAVCRRMRRLEAFLYLTAQNFELFRKKRFKKPIAVDVLSEAYPMIPLSCRSNLAIWYL
jgi:hypothetical protein